jgi:hypothetical protein
MTGIGRLSTKRNESHLRRQKGAETNIRRYWRCYPQTENVFGRSVSTLEKELDIRLELRIVQSANERGTEDELQQTMRQMLIFFAILESTNE